ncbi:MAG: excisionase family DNA-binding protein [Eubacteriales bacterium]|nr:excisionase family DNA-binding protein [Eubacteriales bacterium]
MNTRITVAEMAEELGSNKNYIGDLLTAGYIKHIKVGRNYKVKREWFDEFIGSTPVLPSYRELQIQAKLIREADKEVA